MPLRRLIVVLLILAIAPAYALCAKRSGKPKRKSTATTIFEKYPYFHGEKEINPDNLATQNRIADEHHLPRITNETLPKKIEEGFLICVLCSERKDELLNDQKLFKVDLLAERRFISPEALRYIERAATAHSEEFKKKK